MDALVRQKIEAGLEIYRRLGCELVDIRMPHTDYAIATYYIIATAEASSNLARYDGVRFGSRVDSDSLLAMYRKTRGAGFRLLNRFLSTTSLPRQEPDSRMNPWLDSMSQSTGLSRVAAAVRTASARVTRGRRWRRTGHSVRRGQGRRGRCRSSWRLSWTFFCGYRTTSFIPVCTEKEFPYNFP